MKIIRTAMLCVLPLFASVAIAGQTTDAAVGGGLGGAVGGALGSEIGGRNGAIIGAGVGAAAGAAINTPSDSKSDSHHHESEQQYRRYEDHQGDDRRGHFCPPGQAKKGKC